MSWPDYAILGLIVISLLVGLLRGFMREVLSLVVWFAAFWVAFSFTSGVSEWLGEGISQPSVRMAIGFAGLFLATLLVGGLLVYLVGELVDRTGLSGTDRLLGAVFGGLRGLVLVAALILLAGFTPVPADPWWQESALVQRLLPLAEWGAGWLPESLQEHLDFEGSAPETEAGEGPAVEPQAPDSGADPVST